MASDAIFSGGENSGPPGGGAALQHGPWRSRNALASGLAAVERFLGGAGFDRAPWVAVGFAAGIALWFDLGSRGEWLGLLAFCGAMICAALAVLRADGLFPYSRLALLVMAGAIGAGCLVVWAKASIVGAPSVSRPMVERLTGEVLAREEQPAERRVRLLLATREPGTNRPIVVRINLAESDDAPEFIEGAVVQARVRLMPPSPPMLPGSYDFARSAWFAGIAATGSALEQPKLVKPSGNNAGLDKLQRSLSAHVRSRLEGSPGGIAAAFASGDRGGIAKSDEDAMRDAGLSHLLSISGLHVSAVIAAAYFFALKLLALWSSLALRVRLPILAAAAGAAAGIGYTLLTGAEVPTVRSCIGALLVLLALALGREPLSLRMVAVAALFVMLLWPEAVVGPSFQMSFGAVIAIVALHGSEPVRRFLAPREEAWWERGLRRLAMLVLTGVVIEAVLLPIGLFHFHKAGVYGALANVIAIPLTTFVTMPLIALALALDAVGAGAPVWWLCGKSLELLLSLAHWTAAQPGAVTRLPASEDWAFAVFIGGALWLALWRGRVRLLGLLPAALSVTAMAMARPPDLMISGDGRHVGIVQGDGLLILREGRSSFARDNLTELAGTSGEVTQMGDWSGARCSRDYCAVRLDRGGRAWRLLLGRSSDGVEERQLAAACDRADIVISDRWLPASCRPLWFVADRDLLARTGGVAVNLERGSIRTVAESQGEHGWWRGNEPRLEFGKTALKSHPASDDRRAKAETMTSHPGADSQEHPKPQ